MNAWEWTMEPATLEIWQKSVGDLVDVEAAEIAVIELYQGWTRQRGRHPMFGDLRESYDAVCRRLEQERAEEERAKLPAPDESKIPPELRAKAAKRGGDLVRA